MKHVITFALVPLLALPLLGCEDKPSAPPGAPAASSSQAAPVADTDIAVPADYEEKAASDIRKDNYETELDKLDTDINR